MEELAVQAVQMHLQAVTLFAIPAVQVLFVLATTLTAIQQAEQPWPAAEITDAKAAATRAVRHAQMTAAFAHLGLEA
jgi:hypothetical protein